MTKTFTSSWASIHNGEQTAHDVLDTRTIGQTEVRWRGVSEQTGERHNPVNSASNTAIIGPGEGVVAQTNAPNVPPDAFSLNFYIDGSSVTQNPPTTHRIDVLNLTAGPTVESKTGYGNLQIQAQGGTDTTQWGISVRNPDETTTATANIEVAAEYRTQNTINTRNATTTLNGGDSASIGELADGETSAWQSISGLQNGPNTFSHSIGGTGQAEFQFRYTYAESAAVPTPVSSEPTTAAIADETVVAPPTPVSSEPLAALRDSPKRGRAGSHS